MTLPVPMGSKDEPGHVCRWKRLPSEGRTAAYQCTECSKAKIIRWNDNAPRTQGERDREFVRVQGGVFAGEMFPDPTPAQIAQKMLEIPGYGRY